MPLQRFIGRAQELEKLQAQKRKAVPRLVVIKGDAVLVKAVLWQSLLPEIQRVSSGVLPVLHRRME